MAELTQYLPQGALWQSEQIQALFIGLTLELTRVKQQGDLLFKETFAAQTQTYLPLHEVDNGLPNHCANRATINQSSTARKQSLLAHIRNNSGQRGADYLSLAQALGYDSAVLVEHKPFQCGLSKCAADQKIGDPRQRHHWRLNIPDAKKSQFHCGQSRCGVDALGKVETADDLICAIQIAQPTQSLPNITYQGE